MRVVIVQREVIHRRYLLEVPDGMSRDDIEENFFDRDAASGQYFKEDYSVELIHLRADVDVPADAAVIELMNE